MTRDSRGPVSRRRAWSDQEIWDAFCAAAADPDGEPSARSRVAQAHIWDILITQARLPQWRLALSRLGLEPYDLADETYCMLAENPGGFPFKEDEGNRSLKNYLTHFSGLDKRPKTAMEFAWHKLDRDRKRSVSASASPETRGLDDERPSQLEQIVADTFEDPLEAVLASVGSGVAAVDAAYLTHAEALGLAAALEFEQVFAANEDCDSKSAYQRGNEYFARCVFCDEPYTSKVLERVKKRRPSAATRLALHARLGVHPDDDEQAQALLQEVGARYARSGWLNARQVVLVAGDGREDGFCTSRTVRVALLESNGSWGPPEPTLFALRNLLAGLELDDLQMETAYGSLRAYFTSASRRMDTAGLGRFPDCLANEPARNIVHRAAISGLASVLARGVGALSSADIETVARLARIPAPKARCADLTNLALETGSDWRPPGVSLERDVIKVDGSDGPEADWSDALGALGFKPGGPKHVVPIVEVKKLAQLRRSLLSEATNVGRIAAAAGGVYKDISDWLASIDDEETLRAALLAAAQSLAPSPRNDSSGDASEESTRKRYEQPGDPLLNKTLLGPNIDAKQNRIRLLEIASVAECPPIRLYQHLTYTARRIGNESSLRSKCGELLLPVLQHSVTNARRTLGGGEIRD